MKFLILVALLSTPCWGQANPSGDAETNGSCSPAVTGNNNQFTITCQGIPPRLRTQLVDLLSRVAKNQADAEAILGKLDACLQGVKEVREQSAPWNLKDDEKVALRKLLKGTKARVRVDAIPSDRNASLFGLDILSVLGESGWDISDGFSHNFGLDPRLIGVTIIVTHRDFAEAATLQSALHTVLGFVVPAEIDETKKIVDVDDLIVLAIGAKPPVTR